MMKLRNAARIALAISVGVAASLATSPAVASPTTDDGLRSLIALATPESFADAGTASGELGLTLRAAFHSGETSGRYRGVPAEGRSYFDRYQRLLGEAPDSRRVSGFMVDGLVSSEQLELAGLDVAQVVVLDEGDDAFAYGDGMTSVVTQHASSADQTSASSTQRGPVLRWEPDFGKVSTQRVLRDGSEKSEIYQEFQWAMQDHLAAFGDEWAYEHDFKLIKDNQAVIVGVVYPGCVGPGADDFWADRDALSDELLDTNLPDDASWYFDTQISDACGQQDFTVGVLAPGQLSAGTLYWTRIITGAGDQASTPAKLAAEAPRKDVGPLGKYGVNINDFDDNESGAKLLVGPEVYSAPGCRTWRYNEPSAACPVPAAGALASTSANYRSTDPVDPGYFITIGAEGYVYDILRNTDPDPDTWTYLLEPGTEVKVFAVPGPDPKWSFTSRLENSNGQGTYDYSMDVHAPPAEWSRVSSDAHSATYRVPEVGAPEWRVGFTINTGTPFDGRSNFGFAQDSPDPKHFGSDVFVMQPHLPEPPPPGANYNADTAKLMNPSPRAINGTTEIVDTTNFPKGLRDLPNAWWYFDLVDTRQLTLDTFGTSGDSYMYVLDANQTIIAENDDSAGDGDAVVTTTLGPGRYYVVGTGYSQAMTDVRVNYSGL